VNQCAPTNQLCEPSERQYPRIGSLSQAKKSKMNSCPPVQELHERLEFWEKEFASAKLERKSAANAEKDPAGGK
jgi:hypothetical protein